MNRRPPKAKPPSKTLIDRDATGVEGHAGRVDLEKAPRHQQGEPAPNEDGFASGDVLVSHECYGQETEQRDEVERREQTERSREGEGSSSGSRHANPGRRAQISGS